MQKAQAWLSLTVRDRQEKTPRSPKKEREEILTSLHAGDRSCREFYTHSQTDRKGERV